MRFNQSGHQGQARQLDHFRVRWSCDFARWANCFDLLATHEHDPTVMQLRRLAIEDVRGFEKINRVGWLRCGRLGLCGRCHLEKRASKRQAYKKEDDWVHVMILSKRIVKSDCKAMIILDWLRGFQA